MTFTLVGGLDLSLTGAGMAALGIDNHGHFGYTQTAGYDLKKPTLLDQLKRIDFVRERVLDFLDGLGSVDLIFIEEMPYHAKGTAVHQLSALWHSVAGEIARRGIPLARVNVSSLKIYATGKGTGVDKDEVMLAIARRYPDIAVANNNEADAFGLAAMAARKLGHPIEESLPQTHLRAMEKVEEPWNEQLDGA
ncbi:RuvC-like resolvase [Microbacterium phage Phinky]|nr:RuvC-like resolvase [Microbacterium phage Phinky]